MRRTVVISAIASGLILGSVPAVATGSTTSTAVQPSTVTATEATVVSTARAKRSPKVRRGPQGNVLRVSKVRRLPSGGSFITVRGRGFDPRVGIYVGLCVKPRPGQKPSPCGGGVDTDGSTRASAWVSSNPPSYGDNLATKYGRNGRFKVRIYVSSRISNSIDCRTTRCAITTRADHTRANDRSWDLAVPVRFKR